MRTFLLFIFPLSVSHAATWTVSESGGGDFLHIQDAVTHAAPGDRIEVESGTYSEAINPLGKDLEFIATGEAILQPPTSPDAPVFMFNSGETVATVIDGFKFEATGGLGIWLMGSSATLKNLDFTGLGDTYGAAIRHESGTLSIESCSFQEGFATWGGQIFSQDTTMTIESSTFTDNASTESGGAIYAINSDIQISGSHFEGNDTEFMGGAVALIQSTAWVEDNQFIQNSADSGGGVASENGELTSKTNTFDDNTAYDGAGVYSTTCYDPPEDEEVEESVNDCSENESVGSLSFSDEGSLYRDNVALDDGAGVHLDGSYREEDATYSVSFLSTEFTGNFADDKGGGIFAYNYVGLDIQSATFSQNIGESYGGGFYLSNSETPVSITDTVFDRNVAYYGDGGAFYATSDNQLTVTDSTFTDNRADDAGGAILFRKGYHLEITNSLFESNETEKRSGGAIHFEDASFDDDLIVSNNVFRENSSGLHGGAIYANEARDIFILNNVFESNRTATNSAGGALMFWDQTALLIHGNVFIDNGAHYGGAAYAENTWPRVDGEPSNLSVDQWTNNIFRDNRAVLGGGVSFLSNPLTDFRNNTLVGNVGTNDASNLHLYASFGSFRNNLFAYSPEGRAIVAADPTTAQEATFWSNAFWANADGNWGEIEVEEFDGNIEEAPLLVGSTLETAPRENHMVLTANSPLIDAGESSLKDPDGGDSDIGARGGPEFDEDDADQDGVTNQYDCDDSDVFVFPGAEEQWYDGINQDCSLGSDYDKDGDGAESSAYGGPDCVDDDPAILDGCESEEEEPDQEETGKCAALPGKSAPLASFVVLALMLFRRRADQE